MKIRFIAKKKLSLFGLTVDQIMGFRSELSAIKSHPGTVVRLKRFLIPTKSSVFTADFAKNQLRTATWAKLVQRSAFLYFRATYGLLLSLTTTFRAFLPWFSFEVRKLRGDVVSFVVAMFVVCFVDALITDDEPLFEPVEWSLVQTWVLFIFGLAWVAENLICSRYGSYTGRDKRVWVAWYKTFWLIEGWYVLSFGAAAMFVMTPFYNEISYNVAMVVTWWNWYSRVFFFNFLSLYTVLLYLAYYTQLNLRHMGWKKALFYVAVINLGLGYLLYSQFLISFFCYFTDPNWYHKSRLVDYIQLSHEPNKWAWGNSKRDHFSYHKSTTVFWFKTDNPFAEALMFFNIFFFFCLLLTYIYWVVLFRRIYATQEVSYTYMTYCTSALRQFMYFFLAFYIFVIFSFVLSYWRLPIESAWMLSSGSLFSTFLSVLTDYHLLIISLIS